MFQIKDILVLNVDPMLGKIANAVQEEFGLTIITSAYRPEDPGVHGTMPVRGLDFRCRNYVVGNAIADKINARWKYDPNRPDMVCCMYHDVGKGVHLHIQVHPNTVER